MQTNTSNLKEESRKRSDQAAEEGGGRKTRQMTRLVLVGISSGVSAYGTYFLHTLFPYDIVAIVAVLLGGYPVFKETILSLRHFRISMEVSMAVAIIASLLVEQFAVSVLITFFVLLSEYIEDYAVDKGRQTIVLLEKSAPKRALVRRNGLEQEVDVQSLQTNDIVIVRDGERIPVDGTIAVGSAFVNQAAITGESQRFEKNPGDKVYAGSINESGLIEVRTERVGSETIFGKIIKLVEEAENRKAPIQRISDRLAAYLVEFAIGFAFVTFLLTRNPITTLSVVVVAGACGVAAGTPLAIVAVMGKGAKKGAIIKGGAYVEEMNKVDTIVIDKTGTLTFGDPIVNDIVNFGSYTKEDVLEYAAVAERHSNHPLAHAITNKARELGLNLSESSSPYPSRYIPGKGIIAEHDGGEIVVGNNVLMTERQAKFPANTQGDAITNKIPGNGGSIVLVAYHGEVCGMISITDMIRKESKDAISDLKKMGIRTIMLTGDNKNVAEAVAKEVGIDAVHAELLPDAKLSIVEDLVSKGHKVAMVGDGINDAPALARANVGIGMGAGTDVAIEEADIVLMTNDLQKIADVAKLSRKAYRTIMTNFYGTVTVDGIGVALAALGFLNPLLAAGIHVTSELIFILNSARLIR
ncbi:MAG: cation-translocating P-type ATPase [Nitrososphaerota archaeon]|nr:cation-translocating P-type ATPase [Nitrososphaerota archaeon]